MTSDIKELIDRAQKLVEEASKLAAHVRVYAETSDIRRSVSKTEKARTPSAPKETVVPPPKSLPSSPKKMAKNKVSVGSGQKQKKSPAPVQKKLASAKNNEPKMEKEPAAHPRNARRFYRFAAVDNPQIAPQIKVLFDNVEKGKNIPESELRDILETLKNSGKLETVQRSWDVFKYYRSKLEALKLLRIIRRPPLAKS